MHLRNRDYVPGVGRFTEVDPLPGVPGETTVGNPYHYANNDPLNQIDPLGLTPLRDDDLQQRYRCVTTLNCTLTDFDAMTISERRDWLEYFTSTYAINYNAANWFNNIDAVLRFFDERNLGASGTWASLVDATILGAIQGGMAQVRGVQSYEQSSSASKLWARFFRTAEGFDREPAGEQLAILKELWGTAEQEATDMGLSITRALDVEGPDAKSEFLFIEVGNFYRKAVADPQYAERALAPIVNATCGMALNGAQTLTRGCEKELTEAWIAEEFDPRNGAAVYDNAVRIWNNSLYRNAAAFYIDKFA